MILRPFQRRAIAAARASVLAGHRAPLIVAPTGAGKTVMMAEIARSHVSRGEGRSVAWFAHRTELVKQAGDTLRSLGLEVGYLGQNVRAPVQVISTQACLARGEAPPGTLGIFDEGHHYAAPEYKKVVELYRNALLVGGTATPERGDGLGLGDLFDDMIVAAQRSELIGLGLLAGCDVVAPKRIVDRRIAQYPADAYVQHAMGRSAVVFVGNIQAALECRTQFVEKGIRAEVVHGKTPGAEREDTLARFAEGMLRVLINVFVLTEGWDAPIAKVALLARNFGSTGAFDQAVGRILRPYKGDRALLIDLFGTNVATHGSPEEDRLYSLEGVGIRRKAENVDQFCQVHQIPRDSDGKCPECGDRVVELGMPGVSGVELDKWAAVPADRRVHVLAGLMRKGQSPKQSRVVYMKLFKHWPSKETWAKAEAMAR